MKENIGAVATKLHDETRMNQTYLMNLLLDVEDRIKTKEIYGGNTNFSQSNFNIAGDYILETYNKMNIDKSPNFVFDEEAIKDLYHRVDKPKK